MEKSKEGAEEECDEGDATGQVATADSTAVAPVLSKNAQKRLLKRAKIVEQRAVRKQNRKERRKEQKNATASAENEGSDGQPPTKRQRTDEEEREWVARLGGRGSRNREWFDEERKKGQRVVIDLSFDNLMTDREVKSLVTQVAHLYGCNRKSTNPLHLHLTSVGQRCEEGLKRISGFENWKCESDTRHLSEIFEKSKIVYLTAESDTVLKNLDAEHVYVVGGIVDHNRIKGHCYNAALKAGWKTAKLPLEGNVAMGDHRKVLTVNHVFEILLKFQETGSWRDAMQAQVPERKLKKFEQPNKQAETNLADSNDATTSRKAFENESAADAVLLHDDDASDSSAPPPPVSAGSGGSGCGVELDAGSSCSASGGDDGEGAS
jgi:tRNA (guanine9-N1)-methyltransferase